MHCQFFSEIGFKCAVFDFCLVKTHLNTLPT